MMRLVGAVEEKSQRNEEWGSKLQRRLETTMSEVSADLKTRRVSTRANSIEVNKRNQSRNTEVVVNEAPRPRSSILACASTRVGRDSVQFTELNQTQQLSDVSGQNSTVIVGGYQRPHGIQNYKGIKESGYIDDWLITLDRACDALKWNGNQKVYNLVAYLDPAVKEHLKTYADIDSESYENMCAILRRKYGAERMREHCRNNLQFNSKKTDETTEDFLDRLIREHKTGWLDAEIATRDKEVLNILIQGVRAVQLGHWVMNTRNPNTSIIHRGWVK